MLITLLTPPTGDCITILLHHFQHPQRTYNKATNKDNYIVSLFVRYFGLGPLKGTVTDVHHTQDTKDNHRALLVCN